MVDVGATNCGFGIYFNDSTNGVTRGAYFYSKEYGGGTLNPKLTVTYSGAQINWCGFSDNDMGQLRLELECRRPRGQLW